MANTSEVGGTQVPAHEWSACQDSFKMIKKGKALDCLRSVGN
jgi:hypothetical protein